MVKVKQSLYKPYYRLIGLHSVEVPRFLDNQHMKEVRLSALSTSCLYPQKIFLVLIFVAG